MSVSAGQAGPGPGRGCRSENGKRQCEYTECSGHPHARLHQDFSAYLLIIGYITHY